METVSFGGRPVAGFALGQAPAGGGAGSVAASPAFAAVMTGATVGLLAYVLHAPLWADILAGAGAAVTTKWAIDRSAT